MIDPKKITDYSRTENELQEFILFAIVVAGKNSQIQAAKLERFRVALYGAYRKIVGHSPISFFSAIRVVGPKRVKMLLEGVKMGQYSRINQAFTEVAKHDACHLTLPILEGIKGVGPKTARFFMLHTTRNFRCAVLDTHILKYIRQYIDPSAPLSTPQSLKRYKELEKKFIDWWEEKFSHLYSLADFDLQVWTIYNTR